MEKTRLAIIGSGPAGYTTGIYASRARLEPTLFAGIKSGGQLMWTSDIENYPGFPEGKPGPQLMMDMRAQAEKFGTNIQDTFVTAVDFSQRPFKLWTHFPEGMNHDTVEFGGKEKVVQMAEAVRQSPHDYEADAVVIAAGAVANTLGVPGERDFMGKGVSTCAVCDAAFYKDKTTYVIGGGDSAMEDTLALTKFASSVTILHRREELRASKIMQECVLNNDKVKVMWNTTLEEVHGDSKVTGIKVKENGEEKELPADGVFLAIGHTPMTAIFQNQIQVDNHGYIITRMSHNQAGAEMAQRALNEEGLVTFPTMTSVEGVFAAGDIVDVRYKQAVTAAGQGSAAAIDAERWVEAQS